MSSIETILGDLLGNLLAAQPIADNFIGSSTPDVGSSWTLGGGIQPY
ncbi:hypothetical protein [Rhodococcus gannanensis]|jgi:hypothetical protein|uniref:Uncharacterized protein n=1 Tax=Rhodococcus gannanensis TaxID=1960308 RepID=A0ABW4P8Q8_9NOCA